jgi:Tol biopolymer transport system component
MNEHQLYLFNHAGQVKAVLDESLPHDAFGFSWSPDGRYIAFWNADSLMIYDRQQDWVFDTCISGRESGVTTNPFWSPDSQQIIARGVSTQPILVNWQEKRVYKIKTSPNIGTLYGGWMNSIP